MRSEYSECSECSGYCVRSEYSECIVICACFAGHCGLGIPCGLSVPSVAGVPINTIHQYTRRTRESRNRRLSGGFWTHRVSRVFRVLRETRYTSTLEGLSTTQDLRLLRVFRVFRVSRVSRGTRFTGVSKTSPADTVTYCGPDCLGCSVSTVYIEQLETPNPHTPPPPINAHRQSALRLRTRSVPLHSIGHRLSRVYQLYRVFREYRMFRDTRNTPYL